MFLPFLRNPSHDRPSYGKNSEYFTLEVRYGGQFFDKPNNVVYEGGFILFVDYFHGKWCTKENLHKFLHGTCDERVLKFYYKKQKMSLGRGLTRLETEEDVKGMLLDRDGHSDVKIYVVARMQSYALPLQPWSSEVDKDQTFEVCYIPSVGEVEVGEHEGNWLDQCLQENADELWSQFEQTLEYQNEEPRVEEEVEDRDEEPRGDEEVEDQDEEPRADEEVEGLVKSDYEMDIEQELEGGSEWANFDFGFGVSNEQFRDSDTDYGNSDDLRSIDSEEDGDTTSRRGASNAAFHVQTDLENPVFRTGLVFESNAILKELDPGAYGWLEGKPASHWSKSHFRERNQCDMLLNNLCESFNSTIVAAREKPILTMLEDIRVYLMRRIVARRNSCDRWIACIGPRIQKILEKHTTLARLEWAEYAGNEKFQVRHNTGPVQHAVDLRARTCTCRGWQLSGIPCSHVVASIISRGLNVMEFVDDVYKKDTYIMTYTPTISPITGPNEWRTRGLNPLNPPMYTKKTGRPKKKKNRRRELNEVASSSQPTRSTSQSTSGATTGQRKRSGLVITCRKCGGAGHNKRGCKGAPPPTPN